MKSHELAKILLDGPDLNIVTHANNHTTRAETMRVGLMRIFGGERCIGIGNFSRRHVNHPNDYVIEEIDGGDPMPDSWR